MKTKQLFKSHLFSLAALFSMALAAVSCANEDIAQNGKTGENGKGFATFVQMHQHRLVPQSIMQQAISIGKRAIRYT